MTMTLLQARFLTADSRRNSMAVTMASFAPSWRTSYQWTWSSLARRTTRRLGLHIHSPPHREPDGERHRRRQRSLWRHRPQWSQHTPEAQDGTLGAVGSAYAFSAGKLFNLNADAVIMGHSASANPKSRTRF
jgi:hypothetical protein